MRLRPARRVGGQERHQRKVTVLVPLDDRARSADDYPPHAQARRPLHLEPGHLHALSADELLLRVPDAEAIHGDRAAHAGRHAGDQRLVDPKIGFALAAEPRRDRQKAIPCCDVDVPEPQPELTRRRRWAERAGDRERATAGIAVETSTDPAS